MKKYWYILLMMLCCSLAFTACGDDDDPVVDEAWKQQNDDAFEAIANNPEYKELKSLGNNGSVYYKVLKEGEGTKQVYYTSTVKVYYTGILVDGEVFKEYEPPYQNPATISVNGSDISQGMATALQYMHVGDRWEIWIPYQLSYGATGYIANKVMLIPGYSTLKYELEIVEIL